MTCIKLGAVSAFPHVAPDKEHALKPLEEAAEVFGAWQGHNKCSNMCGVCCHTDESRAAYQGPEDKFPAPCPSREAVMDEIADTIQACCNLAAALGVEDMTPYLARCEERNRKRGRYGEGEPK